MFLSVDATCTIVTADSKLQAEGWETAACHFLNTSVVRS